MSLVLKIRGKKAPAGASKLYRDPLVDFAGDATLALFDFSNGGAFLSQNIIAGTELMDLSREVSQPRGLDNTATLKTAEGKEDAAVITAGGGFLVSSVSQNGGLANPQGFDAGLGLPTYLSNNNPRALVSVWFRVQDVSGGALFTGMNSESGNFFGVRAAPSTTNIRLAGVSAGAVSLNTGQLYHLAAEFVGVGQPLRRFVNGQFVGEGTSPTTGFVEDFEPLLLGVRSIANPDVAIYRMSFFDLTLTDRTADEIVSYDWDYCHGSGDFAGKPTKRPFIDVL